jgi:hypothetical protein
VLYLCYKLVRLGVLLCDLCFLCSWVFWCGVGLLGGGGWGVGEVLWGICVVLGCFVWLFVFVVWCG